MIAHLKKISADDKIIIYAYSYESGPMDGLITIDLTKGLADIKPATGNKGSEHMAGNAVGKIMRWYDEKKLPDKYTICIG